MYIFFINFVIKVNIKCLNPSYIIVFIFLVQSLCCQSRRDFVFLKRKFICFLSNPCSFSYMHNRREYLSGKANGLGLPSREEGISLGAAFQLFQLFQLILSGFISFACPFSLLLYII